MAQLSYSQIWEVQIGSCESRYHVIQALEAHIHVYTYFVYGEKWPLDVRDNGKCNVIDICIHVFCAFRVNGV